MSIRQYIITLLTALLAGACSQKPKTLFQLLSAEQSGVRFENKLNESESQNILAYEYFYNGGGVAAADFNNDGLTDLYFTGNQVNNKLYLNRGQLSFEDITQQAGVQGRPGGWKTGVSVADVNADGWLDIYVCYSGNLAPAMRKNQLFINNKNLTFSEQAAAYGLDDDGYGTQAAWLDYDADGDLDVFVMNHNLRGYQRKEAAVMRDDTDPYAGDKLFRNDTQNGQGKFVEVTQQAGIKSNPLGFGLGLVVADVNLDGKPDIYVGNDYVEDDYLYLNQGNGTFRDVAKQALQHTSQFTMGVDIADFNNDQLPDIFTLDMLPEDNARQKKLIFPDNWNVYQAQLENGFHHQNMRNSLQLNYGNGTFGEIGQLAGVSNTDWSWAALFADVDNDGWKDLFVTNGEVRDYTDGDFAKYYADERIKVENGQTPKSLLEHLKQMPTSQTHPYIFKNQRNLTFSNQVEAWGFDEPTTANGAVYADLDNDGDLDLVTNNNNELARVYQNTQQDNLPNNYLALSLKGPPANPFGFGAKVFVRTDTTLQYQEYSPVRGFQSSLNGPLHFGLGTATQASVRVQWPDGKQQTFGNVTANQALKVSYTNAQMATVSTEPLVSSPLLEPTQEQIDFLHTEDPEIDFNRQILLPYLYSYRGSRMAVGDVNADGRPDVYVGGARNQAGGLFLQDAQGRYHATTQKAFELDRYSEDQDAVFFDADGDHDLDLFVVSGDYALLKNDTWQADRLYLNNGQGTFTRQSLPAENLNGSCVKAFDLGADGDIDLFVGGNVVPGEFPRAEASYVLINNGKGLFEQQLIGSLGIINDASALDANRDGTQDLLVVGEWTAPTLLLNRQGKLQAQPLPGTNHLKGWWNSVVTADLDADGDLDVVMGNIGLNHQFKASAQQPLSLFATDVDGNGTIDPFMSYFIGEQAYPAAGRDEALEQVVLLRKQYTSYEAFGRATLPDLLGSTFDQAHRSDITFTETCLLENTPAGFVVRPLPIQAQFGPVHAVAVQDFDQDGLPDLLLAGSQSKFRLRIGRMDANAGVLLRNRGKFAFEYVTQTRSGLRLSGDVKDVEVIGQRLVFSINNNKPLIYKYLSNSPK